MSKGILWATITDTAWAKNRAVLPVLAKHLHVTLAFGVAEDDPVVREWAGKAIPVTVQADCYDDQIQALRVQLPAGVPCKNPVPHITVSMQEGVAPKQSNAMLAGEPTCEPVTHTLEAVIEFEPFASKGARQAALAWVKTATPHYTPDWAKDERLLERANDPEKQAEEAKEFGGYWSARKAIVPIADIDVPEVWNPQREQRLQEAMPAGIPLPPIHLSRGGPGLKWNVGDGIHRLNVSVQQGYTHIPAIISEWVDTPEALDRPTYPELKPGDEVRLKQPIDGVETVRIVQTLPSGVSWLPRYEVEPVGEWGPPFDVSADQMEVA